MPDESDPPIFTLLPHDWSGRVDEVLSDEYGPMSADAARRLVNGWIVGDDDTTHDAAYQARLLTELVHDLGQRVHRVRRANCWSQLEVSNQLDYGHNVVSRLERGSVDTLSVAVVTRVLRWLAEVGEPTDDEVRAGSSGVANGP